MQRKYRAIKPHLYGIRSDRHEPFLPSSQPSFLVRSSIDNTGSPITCHNSLQVYRVCLPLKYTRLKMYLNVKYEKEGRFRPRSWASSRRYQEHRGRRLARHQSDRPGGPLTPPGLPRTHV